MQAEVQISHLGFSLHLQVYTSSSRSVLANKGQKGDRQVWVMLADKGQEGDRQQRVNKGPERRQAGMGHASR